MKRKIGLSLCSKPYDAAAMERYAQAGIQAVEFSFATEVYDAYDFAEGAKTARKYGIDPWSAHLPFVPFRSNNIASLDPTVRQSTIALQAELLKRVGEAEIHLAVIHPSGEPTPPEARAEMMKCAKESLAVLVEAAAREGVTLAVEDLPRSCLGRCVSEITELISVDDRLRVCFDTNHLWDEDNLTFLRALGDKIVTLHVSDYDFVDERHWLPGEGKVDWVALMDGLDEIGYTGVFMYELGFSAPKTILRPRDLTAEDFVRNAEELMARGPITVLGKPNL